MKKIRTVIAGLMALAFSACGYHLGGVKPESMKDMNTFCVEMFENNTVQPSLGILMTTAMGNTLQSDGTYRMAPRSEADFILKGTVTHIKRDSLRTDPDDTYVSSEIGLTVYVSYEVVDRRTGKVIQKGSEEATGNYFNQDVNTVSAMDSALSYASRLVAEDIVFNLTNP
ncbi:MAG: hypothetical protein IJE88_02530 [Akkermansia sp.]|nr:hypothetical protein [Akkermansia sp.]